MNQEAKRIAVNGICGRMGSLIARLIQDEPDLQLDGGIEAADHPCQGKECEGTKVGAETPAGVDVLIDFTAPEATRKRLAECRQQRIGMVIGTTGLTPEDREAIDEASREIPVFLASNMSIGIHLLNTHLPKMLADLGQKADVEIVEMHHNKKKDSPSGTAITLAEGLAAARKQKLADVARHGREGMVGERTEQEIGIHAVRGGDVPGEHRVIFAWQGERVEVVHRATGREAFARGAVQASRFLAGKEPGLYGMDDLLGRD